MQEISKMIRISDKSSYTTLDERHIRRHQRHGLAQSLGNLLPNGRQPATFSTIDLVASGPTDNATCQWVVDLTYQVIKCTHVGIAYIDDQSRTIRPLAHAGQAQANSTQWWERVQSALFAEPYRPPDATQLTGNSSAVRLPVHRGVRARQAHANRSVYVVPMGTHEKVSAIFVVEPTASTPTRLSETIQALRALANLAALALETQVYGRAQMAQAADSLPSALQEMDNALALVSHELKSPLTTIIASLQVARSKVERLAQTVLSSPDVQTTALAVRDLLTLAARSARIGDRIVTDLVDASRIRSSRITLSPKLSDLGQIVRDAVRSHRILSSTRIIHLDVPESNIPVFVDPDRVAQVVTNFLANALKYSHEEAPVEAQVRVRQNDAQVLVRDHGPGLEKAELEHVWERFYRGSGVSARGVTGSGLGLGLYISREIIRGHGGTVGATSVPGHGASFWFTLPLTSPT